MTCTRVVTIILGDTAGGATGAWSSRGNRRCLVSGTRAKRGAWTLQLGNDRDRQRHPPSAARQRSERGVTRARSRWWSQWARPLARAQLLRNVVRGTRNEIHRRQRARVLRSERPAGVHDQRHVAEERTSSKTVKRYHHREDAVGAPIDPRRLEWVLLHMTMRGAGTGASCP